MLGDLYQPADFDVRIRAVIHGFGIVVGAFVTGIVLVNLVALGLIAGGVELSLESMEFYVLSAVGQFAAFILVVLAYLQYYDDVTLFEWGRPSLRQVGLIVAGFVALYLLNILAGIIVLALGVESATNAVVSRGQENPELFLYMIPITVLLVAPGEELVFRGVLQGWFRRAFGVVPGVLGASLVFGAVHAVALQGSGVVVYVAVAAMLGIVLGALYEYSGNMVVPIAVHGLYNALLFSIQYLVAIGYVTPPS